ncbi:ArfGap-domain-containing protein [Dissoconium aciculare CBS 342.82]|uniref:ArfGap-domain-containing protein n=1 Tax=Dissoconium aciculare CBS 342.82 TaxID=1314786 RepID=A0A6J3M989_9PEZI|nr:ArfGap-domain-containing protein [Dissoconium aciculare CBS 342.82]KAF1823382.1 ArfGap-domain-containing protein [Dissoconium aciculare CBS 342.82]
MSRQTSSGSAAQNTATLKQLVKLESNKSCADCKRNKHPRWASWNLGIFICIRCSGIHRGMGTHISRVKSVDLDTWTDEQMQSMVKWGNARANRYWESKLAEGHVPNEAKIENFIRTKYDSRRWAMDGPIPDPSTLGGEDDDVPLNVVQENLKAQIASGSRGAGHARNGSSTMVGGGVAPPPRAARQQPQIDLFGDEQPARASSANPVSARPQPVAAPALAPAPSRQTRPQESLLGLDFFGGAQAAPPARAATASPSAQGASGRSDLKQSILSLYASKPAAPPASANGGAFGGMQSPPLVSPSAQSASSALGGLGDAFGSLSFSSPAPQQQAARPAAFSNFLPPAGHAKQASISKPTTSALSGGSFFDTKPAVPPKSTSTAFAQDSGFDSDFGAFSSATSPAPVSSVNKSSGLSSNAMGDLFSLAPASAPTPPPKTSQAPPPPTATAAPSYSAFNLSQPTPAPPKPAAPATSSIGGFNNMDAWGSSDAWATPDPPAAAKPAAPAAPKSSTTALPSSSAAMFETGWGNESSSIPQATHTSASTTTSNTKPSAGGFSVQQDEEFGGWSHASPVATPSAGAGTGGGNANGSKGFGASGGGSDDLFGNVWG